MTEFFKCYYCKNYNGYETVCNPCEFDPSVEKIKSRAIQAGITVNNVIGLIRLCECLRVMNE